MRQRPNVLNILFGVVGVLFGASTAIGIARGKNATNDARAADSSTAAAPTAAASVSPTATSRPIDLATLLTKHAAEAEDASWSKDAATRLKADLSTAFPGATAVSRVDCRTTLCTAAVTFSNPDPEWETLLGKRLSVNCGKILKLENGATQSTLRVIFDCSYTRAHPEG